MKKQSAETYFKALVKPVFVIKEKKLKKFEKMLSKDGQRIEPTDPLEKRVVTGIATCVDDETMFKFMRDNYKKIKCKADAKFDAYYEARMAAKEHDCDVAVITKEIFDQSSYNIKPETMSLTLHIDLYSIIV